MKNLILAFCLSGSIFSLQAMYQWPEKHISLTQALGYDYKDDVMDHVKKGEDPNQIVNIVTGDALLHDVAQRKDWSDAAKLILEKGANVNAQNHDGATPLHYAVALNNKEMARLLLDQPNILLNKKIVLRAKPYSFSDQSWNFFSHYKLNGLTPLEIAEKNNNQDLINLIKAKAPNK